MALRFGSPAHPDGGLRFGTSAYQELGVAISSVTTDGVTGQIVPGLSATILVGEPIGATQGAVRLKANGYTLALTITSWDDSTDTITVTGSRDTLPYGTGATLEVELDDGSIGTQTVEIAPEANVLYFDCTSVNDTHENSIWNAYITETAESLGTTDSNGDLSTTLNWTTGIKPESVEVVVSTSVATDDGAGNLTGDFTGTIDYATSAITITGAPASTSAAADYERKIEQPAGDYQAIANDPNGVGPDIDSSGVITSVVSNGSFDLFVYDKSTGDDSSTTNVTANLNPPQGQVTITDTTVSGSDVTITWSYDDTDITGWGWREVGGSLTEFGDDQTTSHTITGLADGTYDIEIVPINDGGEGAGTDTTTATINTSTAPTLDSEIPDQTGKEGDSFNLDLSSYISGADSYSVSGLPSGTGLTLDASTGELAGTLTADDVGANSITATGTNTNGSVDDTFSLTVDALAPPTLDSDIPEQYGIEGEAFTVQLSDYISGADSYSIAGLPTGSGLTLDSASGELSGTASAEDVGTSTFTVTATNADGSIDASFELTVWPGDITLPAHARRTLQLQDNRLTYDQAESERLDYDVDMAAWLEQGGDEYESHEILGDSAYVSYDVPINGERIKVWLYGVDQAITVSVLVRTTAGRIRQGDLVINQRDSVC